MSYLSFSILPLSPVSELEGRSQKKKKKKKTKTKPKQKNPNPNPNQTLPEPSAEFFFFFFFSGPPLRHMEVPRLGIKLELQLPVYATAMPDPSLICDLHWQCQILKPTERGLAWRDTM